MGESTGTRRAAQDTSDKRSTKKARKDALRAIRGINDQYLTSLAESTTLPVKEVTSKTLKARDHVAAVYSDMAKAYRNKTGAELMIGGCACPDWSTATSLERPLWNINFIKAYFAHYGKTAKPVRNTQTQISKQTYDEFVRIFLGAYSSARFGKTFSKEERKHVFVGADNVAAQLGIVRTEVVRAMLTVDSLKSLLKACTHLHCPFRTALTTAMYIAAASSTGLRFGSLCRGPGRWSLLEEHRQGLRWKDVTLWATPGDQGANAIVAWVTPRHSKSETSRGTSYPLMDAPELGLSANLLFLAAAEYDGALSDSLANILDPAFLSNGRPRRIDINAENAEKFIFLTSRAKTISLSYLDELLVQASKAVGFEKHVTTTCFRWMVAQTILKNATSSDAQGQLGHLNGSVTRRYYGKAAQHCPSLALFGGQTMWEEGLSVTNVNAIPHGTAPRTLTRTEFDEILSDTAISAIRTSHAALVTKVVEKYGHLSSAPQELQREDRRLKERYASVFQTALESKRRSWFLELKQTGYLPPATDWSKEDPTITIASGEIMLRHLLFDPMSEVLRYRWRVLPSGVTPARDGLRDLLSKPPSCASQLTAAFAAVAAERLPKNTTVALGDLDDDESDYDEEHDLVNADAYEEMDIVEQDSM